MLPPFVDIRSVQTLVDGDRLLIGYGAQDLSPHDSGAYTGDISGPMLAKLGCSYVVVGHSERRRVSRRGRRARQRQGRAAFRHGLADPVRRRAARGARGRRARRALRAQLDGALGGLTAEQGRTIVIAYEPIWAIGTGKVATPTTPQEVCAAHARPGWPRCMSAGTRERRARCCTAAR